MSDELDELERILDELEPVELPEEIDVPDPDLDGIDFPDLDDLPEPEPLDDLDDLFSDID